MRGLWFRNESIVRMLEEPPRGVPVVPPCFQQSRKAQCAEHPKADEIRDDKTRQIAPDVAYRQIAIVNVIFFGP